MKRKPRLALRLANPHHLLEALQCCNNQEELANVFWSPSKHDVPCSHKRILYGERSFVGVCPLPYAA